MRSAMVFKGIFKTITLISISFSSPSFAGFCRVLDVLRYYALLVWSQTFPCQAERSIRDPSSFEHTLQMAACSLSIYTENYSKNNASGLAHHSPSSTKTHTSSCQQCQPKTMLDFLVPRSTASGQS